MKSLNKYQSNCSCAQNCNFQPGRATKGNCSHCKIAIEMYEDAHEVREMNGTFHKECAIELMELIESLKLESSINNVL